MKTNSSIRLRTSPCAGLSLVEVIVVLAIIGVLAAIMLAVLQSGRSKGKESDALSRLKQIGLAGALYQEEHGAWPAGVYELVLLKALPEEMARSPLDVHPNGLANRLAEDRQAMAQPQAKISPIFESFPGRRAWGLGKGHWSFIESKGDAVGWLVDLTISEHPDGYPWEMSEGKYRRLLLDTAVVTRVHSSLPGAEDPENGPGRSASALFADFTAEDIP